MKETLIFIFAFIALSCSGTSYKINGIENKSNTQHSNETNCEYLHRLGEK